MADDDLQGRRSASRAELVETFWLNHRATFGADPDEERAAELGAWEEVNERMRVDSPEDAVNLLIALTSAAEDDEEIGYLGADAIEDLVVYRSAEVVDLVEAAAIAHTPFRQALMSTWFEGDVSPAIAQRLRELREPR